MSRQSSVPNFFRGAIRRAGLHNQADALKYVLKRAKRWRANRAFRRSHPDVAFPPPYMLYEAFNLDYEKYYVDGYDTAKAFCRYLRPALGRDGEIFLDWGCGPARLTRHMPELLPPGTRVHGVDANAETIAWCRIALPELQFSVCGLRPPLGFSGGSVQAALGLYVLTHLPVAAQKAWLSEFARILAPGGRLVITTHGDAFRERLDVRTRNSYDKGGLVVAAHGREGHRL